MTGIRTLLPPGGFSNLVGLSVAALDLELEHLAETVRRIPPAALDRSPAPGLPAPDALLRGLGDVESSWVHAAVGGVPTPPAPAPGAGADALLAWLAAVRTVTVMVLRPLPDRDLERLVRRTDVPEATTLRRVLVELLARQAAARGELAAVATLIAPPGA